LQFPQLALSRVSGQLFIYFLQNQNMSKNHSKTMNLC